VVRLVGVVGRGSVGEVGKIGGRRRFNGDG